MGAGPDVLVVGGGVIGLSTAYQIARLDPAARVRLLERERVGAAASGASAAGVRVMGRDRAERALALASLARWPELAQELGAATGYQRGGGLRVVLDEAGWAAAETAVAEQRADGVPVELLDAASARALVPSLADDCLGGSYCPIDGQADPAMTVHALAAAARRSGVGIQEETMVATLLTDERCVRGVALADGAELRADVVVVAAGAWTAALAATGGVRLPLRARALQMLLTEPGPVTLTPVLGCFGQPLSLKQVAGGAYLIGGGWPADITDEPGNRWALRDESVQGNLAVARRVFPPAGAVPLARGWAGIEAFAPDDLPYLGPIDGLGGLLVAAGFSGHGFALAPAVGEILARLTLGQATREELWMGLSASRANRIIED